MKLRAFIPAICWFVMSLVLLCLPGSTIPKYPFLALIHADKWVHIGLFGILCWLFCLPVLKGTIPIKNGLHYFLLIAIAGIFYGTIMEFVQKYWIPNRSFELLDIAADSTGCLITLGYSCWKYKRAGI